MKVVILAPIDNSLYSLLVTHLCSHEPGVEVSGIILRKIFNLRRLKSEFRRDGVRLLRKVWRKLILDNQSDISEKEERNRNILAEEVGWEVRSLQKLSKKYHIPLIKVKNLNEASSVSFLEYHKPDLVLFTGGGIIRKQLLDVSGLGVFNVHMGILPPYRGMDVMEWTILEGRHTDIGLGITLHFMDRGIDTGPIITTRQISIKEGDTFERLRVRYETAMVELMLTGVRMARDGKLQSVTQKEEDGQQYFVMHPRIYDIAQQKLAEIVSTEKFSKGL